MLITGAFRVWKVVLATGAISSIAGNGTAGFSGDGADAALAQFNDLAGMGLSPGGDAFVSDLGNARVRKIAGALPPPPPPVFDGTISLTTKTPSTRG